MMTSQHPAKQRGHEAEARQIVEDDAQRLTVLPSADETVDLVKWLAEQKWSDFAQSLAEFYLTKGYLSEKQINAAQSMRSKVESRGAQRAQTSQFVPADGFYTVDGDIVRVQKARSSDNRYTKTLDVVAREWVYTAQKPFAKCTPDSKLTLDEAKTFGLAHGYCLICTRELTDPESVERGIGPVCAKKLN